MATLTHKQQKAKAYYEANKEARKSYQRDYNKRIAAEKAEPWRKQLPSIREVQHWWRKVELEAVKRQALLDLEMRTAQHVTVPTLNI